MKIAVITGASSGMGQEFAVQINKKCLGLDEIWLIARRQDRLEELSGQLTLPARIFAMDLTDDPSYAELIYALETEKPQVRVMVNCAGYGKTGPFQEIGMEDTLGMIDLNCRALTKMTYLLLPYMPKRSYLIQVASVAGILPQPNFAVYAASKAYVLSLSRGLREELRGKGISVTAVCPGPVATDFFAIAEETGSAFALKKYFVAKKEKVVALALKDAFAKKDMSVYGLSMKALRLLVKVVPQKMILYVYGKLCRNV
ncbi:MAG: SDR family NAD(P)-dependent oxidoreductase [Lachnospiraceae bacterium]|nr:SDR family NAD(P)-dependent oxidoreductase [Lachnospiraceae bacterium]